MAVIYTFPTKATPLGADLVLISDSEDGSSTKNATIASLVTSNAIDVVDTVTASGSGITASPNKGNVVITNTGVTSLIAGSSIGISGSTGAVTLTNTGVTSLDAGAGISLSGATGNITIASTSVYVLPLAANGTRGGVQIGFVAEGRNYPIELALEKMYVNVPWTDTQTPARIAGQGLSLVTNTFNVNVNSTVQTVTANTLSTEAARTYAVQVDVEDELVVNVPWTGGLFTSLATVGTSGVSTLNSGVLNIPNYTFTLSTATSAILGGIKSYVNYGAAQPVNSITTGNTRNYGIGINNTGQAFVNVPWTDANTIYSAGNGLTLNAGNVFSANVNEVGQTTAANSVTDTNAKTYAIQIDSSDDLVVNVPWENTQTPARLAGTGLDLSGNTFNANVDGTQTVAAATSSTTAARTYKVQVDSSDKLVVNVPWIDANTEYTAGTGLTLTGTVFSSDLATSTVRGSIELFSDTGQEVEADTVSATAARTYGLQLNSSNQGVVNVPWTDTQNPVITASQGLTKTSNNITLDIANPTTGWAILGGGAGATTPVISGSAGANATGNKNFGITTAFQGGSVTSANNNIVMGFASMGGTVSTASNNVVLGTSAGNSMTTALDNVIIGQDTGTGLTAGQENTIVGHDSGNTITTGDKNTLIGSGIVASTGAASIGAVAVGRGNAVTTSSTAIGSGASVTGATGTALGNAASVTATNGIAIGQGCAITSSVLGLASASNPIETISSLSDAEIDKYLTVVVNGETRYIALYTGNP